MYGTLNQLLEPLNQAKYFGYSGDRVKGLIFCSNIKESEELSRKFNLLGYRTIALNGSASEQERQDAFERLAMNEEDANAENSIVLIEDYANNGYIRLDLSNGL